MKDCKFLVFCTKCDLEAHFHAAREVEVGDIICECECGGEFMVLDIL